MRKIIGIGKKLGFMSGAIAGFVGQGIVGIVMLLVDSPLAFPAYHHLLYAVLGMLITGVISVVITYQNESILLLREMEE